MADGLHLGLIGYGAITDGLLDLLARDDAPRVERVTLLVRKATREQAEARLNGCATCVPVMLVEDERSLINTAPDLVVECAGPAAVAEHGPAILEAGIDLVVISIGALTDDDLAETLQAAARKGRARLRLPAGAIGGIDLLAALGAIGPVEVTYRGTKPPHAWRQTPAEETIDLGGLTDPTAIFRGTAREAAKTFPKNANVAATLALAGGGLDTLKVELIADPSATGNSHSYEVVAPSARFTMAIESKPSDGNTKTSVATIYSLLREIRNHAGPVSI